MVQQHSSAATDGKNDGSENLNEPNTRLACMGLSSSLRFLEGAIVMADVPVMHTVLSRRLAGGAVHESVHNEDFHVSVQSFPVDRSTSDFNISHCAQPQSCTRFYHQPLCMLALHSREPARQPPPLPARETRKLHIRCITPDKHQQGTAAAAPWFPPHPGTRPQRILKTASRQTPAGDGETAWLGCARCCTHHAYVTNAC